MRLVLIRLLVAVAAVSSAAVPSFAQAWVAPAGIGAVNLVYQTIANTGHRLADGSMLEGYDSASRSVLVEFDYAVTDRLSFSAGLPYVGAKYQGPEPSFFGLDVDNCLCWTHGWQDVNVTVRYNLLNDAFALTPSISFGSPTHEYNYFGEAVLGRNLNEVRLALDAGQRLDFISPRLLLTGRYSYAFVEKVLDIPNNRSNMALELGYFFTRQISARGLFSWQRSHGGLRSTEFESEEHYEQFDRLLRDNFFHVGGSVAYSLPRIDVFFAYVHYADGTDTHAGRAITIGMSWPFQLR